jgi:hypothetical protein
MGTPQPIIRTGNPTTSTVQIDQMLSELARLYLVRFKAMRTNDMTEVARLNDQIAAIKTVLGQI